MTEAAIGYNTSSHCALEVSRGHCCHCLVLSCAAIVLRYIGCAINYNAPSIRSSSLQMPRPAFDARGNRQSDQVSSIKSQQHLGDNIADRIAAMGNTHTRTRVVLLIGQDPGLGSPHHPSRASRKNNNIFYTGIPIHSEEFVAHSLSVPSCACTCTYSNVGVAVVSGVVLGIS
jgi:hypothetical protein